VSALFKQCPGDTVQTGTGEVDPARKFKCTTAARGREKNILPTRGSPLESNPTNQGLVAPIKCIILTFCPNLNKNFVFHYGQQPQGLVG